MTLLTLIAAYIGLFVLTRILLGVLAWQTQARNRPAPGEERAEPVLSGQEPPVSIIMPARNEEEGIVDAVRSMLQLRYANLEIIVVNDGSGDATLERLNEAFGLTPVPISLPRMLQTETIRGCYLSSSQPRLRVLDKAAGGKADALNAGINASVYPLIFCADADCVLDRDALLHLAQHFILDPDTVACGGTRLPQNGNVVREGHLVEAALPHGRMERIQLVENLRDALLICAGWSSVNGLLLLSGNIMLLQKQAVIDCGGFLRDLVDEDGELILRMHRLLSIAGKPYRIAHSSNALGWTEVPRDRSKLRASRVRRYRGLCESVSLNQAMLWRGRPNVAGWIALPCLMLFECACPLVEVAGYVLLAALFVTGVLEWAAFLLLLAIALGLAILLPALSLLLEEACYRRTKDTRDTLALLADIAAGQFGDRQRKLLWSLEGMWQWVTGKRGGRRVTTRRTQP